MLMSMSFSSKKMMPVFSRESNDEPSSSYAVPEASEVTAMKVLKWCNLQGIGFNLLCRIPDADDLP
jgi:hypothetical protein